MDFKTAEECQAFMDGIEAEAADQSRSEVFSSFISRPNRGE